MKVTSNNVNILCAGLVRADTLAHATTGTTGALKVCQRAYDNRPLTSILTSRPRPHVRRPRSRRPVTDYAGACACEDYPCCGH